MNLGKGWGVVAIFTIVGYLIGMAIGGYTAPFKLTQQELIENGYAYYHPVTGEFKLAPNQPQVVYQQGFKSADHLEKQPTISKGGSQ